MHLLGLVGLRLVGGLGVGGVNKEIDVGLSPAAGEAKEEFLGDEGLQGGFAGAGAEVSVMSELANGDLDDGVIGVCQENEGEEDLGGSGG